MRKRKEREGDRQRGVGESQRREKKRGRENKILNFKFTTCEQWVVYLGTYYSQVA